jgi:hypothetical protein
MHRPKSAAPKKDQMMEVPAFGVGAGFPILTQVTCDYHVFQLIQF